MIINLDMDGVIADFYGYVHDNISPTIRELSPRQQWELIATHPHIYRKLSPMPDAGELVKHLKHLSRQYHAQIHILTGIPSMVDMPHAMVDKQQWIEQHFPSLSNVVKFGPYSINKQWHASIGDVLIDDRLLNIQQWNARGGYGIQHISTSRTVMHLHEYLSAITNTMEKLRECIVS